MKDAEVLTCGGGPDGLHLKEGEGEPEVSMLSFSLHPESSVSSYRFKNTCDNRGKWDKIYREMENLGEVHLRD